MEATEAVVRGRAIVPVPVSRLRQLAAAYRRVVVDVGTGDGRWVYRTARAHPDWLCIGLDANADAMREVSFRAGRKPSRGGVANAWFMRMPVETLPGGLESLADELHIMFPWGSLLRAMVEPNTSILAQIARVGKPGAGVEIWINDSALRPGDGGRRVARTPRLALGYARAGIILARWEAGVGVAHTTWGRRIHHGRHASCIRISGVVGVSNWRQERDRCVP